MDLKDIKCKFMAWINLARNAVELRFCFGDNSNFRFRFINLMFINLCIIIKVV
jgi:hypothetical protein